jgi:uncharacterized protein (TIGR03086 family)
MTAVDHPPQLLERAVRYGLSSLEVVTPAALLDPTPCAGWNLRMLLVHLADSLTALDEGACALRIAKAPPPQIEPEDVVADVRARIERLLRDWRRIPLNAGHFGIGDLTIPVVAVEIVASIEIAVHGWDIFETCLTPNPVPLHLALELLRHLPAGQPERPVGRLSGTKTNLRRRLSSLVLV